MALSEPRRRILVLAALICIAGGAVLIAQQVLPTPVPEVVAVPVVIEFAPAAVEMGELAPETSKTVAVQLKNISHQPITISVAIASCACTTATWPHESIAPGASAEATVTIKAPVTPGESLMKTVAFMVDGVGPAVLTVTGRVGPMPVNGVAPVPDSLEESMQPDAPNGLLVRAAAVRAEAQNPPAAAPSTTPAARRSTTFMRVNPPVFPGARVSVPVFTSWVQGEPVLAFAPGKVYVYDFFNTTCSHCKEYAPLISRLAAQYGAQGVQFVAITDERADSVSKWLDEPGRRQEMPYAVVSDLKRNAMMTLQNGTYRNFNPRFFIIKDGVVQWFGHPKEAAEPLAKIVAGTWNPETIRAEFMTESLVARAKDFLDALARECDKTNDWPAMFAGIDSVRAAIPERAGQYDAQRFVVMIGLADMPDAGYEFGHRAAKEHASDMVTIRSLARAVLQSPYVKRRDLDFGMELAVAADQLAKGEDARTADTVALAWFCKGDREKAIENGERAVRLEKDPKSKLQYQQLLQKYRTQPMGPEPARTRPAPAVNPTGAPSGAPVSPVSPGAR